MEYELRNIELHGNMTTINDGSAVTGSGKQPDLFKLMPHFGGKGDITLLKICSILAGHLTVFSENGYTTVI